MDTCGAKAQNAYGAIKRICLFAAYDKDGTVQDYTVYYLKELSSFADIYYLAECEMQSGELERIKPYVRASYAYKHGKYDFGSWQELIGKIGWPALAEYDELILANDSCFAPLYSFNKFFAEADADKEWDALGITKNYDMASRTWYLNSYFIILRKKLILSDIFRGLIDGIEPQKNFSEVCSKYEFPFTRECIRQGYSVKCYVSYVSRMYSEWREMIRHGCLFLKKKSFAGYSNAETVLWERFINKHTDYDTDLIKKYINSGGLYENTRKARLKMLFRYMAKIASRFAYLQFHRGKRKLRLFGVYLINNRPNGDEAYYEDGSIPPLKITRARSE